MTIPIRHVPTRYRPTPRIVRHERREAMIPEHMLYRSPEWWRERYREYGLDFGRWRLDTRFLLDPDPEPLTITSLNAINAAIWRDIRWYHRYRLGRIRIECEICELLQSA